MVSSHTQTSGMSPLLLPRSLAYSIISAVDLIPSEFLTTLTLVVDDNNETTPSIFAGVSRSKVTLCQCMSVVGTETDVVKISISGITVLTSGP